MPLENTSSRPGPSDDATLKASHGHFENERASHRPKRMDEGDEVTDENSNEPFGDLLDEIDRKRSDARDDPFEALGESDKGPTTGDEDLFTDESFDAIDTDELWDDLEGEQETVGVVDREEGEDPEIIEEAETNVVPKRSFCESCRYLTQPPEFRCSHDGTQIVEFVDTDHVRVRDCPIVAERRLESE